MAKRFTDTRKWRKAWFRMLPPKMKCAWLYLCDNCDHAGIWDIDMGALVFDIGEQVSLTDLMTSFDVVKISDTKIFIPDFIEFQYKCPVSELNAGNKAHASVIQILKKYGLETHNQGAMQGATVAPKDKDKDKELEKEEDKEPESDSTRVQWFEEIYSRYPVKVKGEGAFSQFKEQFKTREQVDELSIALDHYIRMLTNNPWRNPKQTFAAFLGTKQSGFFWRDFINPESAKATVNAGAARGSIFKQGPAPIRILDAQKVLEADEERRRNSSYTLTPEQIRAMAKSKISGVS